MFHFTLVLVMSDIIFTREQFFWMQSSQSVHEIKNTHCFLLNQDDTKAKKKVSVLKSLRCIVTADLLRQNSSGSFNISPSPCLLLLQHFNWEISANSLFISPSSCLTGVVFICHWQLFCPGSSIPHRLSVVRPLNLDINRERTHLIITCTNKYQCHSIKVDVFPSLKHIRTSLSSMSF